MHILILNWKDIKNPAKGGAEVIAFEFASRLVKKGHKVTFFSRDFPGALKEEDINGVHVVRRGNMLTVYFEAFFYYKSLRIKPDRVIDMVNTICWQTPLYVPKDKRVFYVNQLAQEVFFYELPKPLSWIMYSLEWLEYITYKNTKALCYSKSTKNDLISFGIPEKNISIFPMGLDHSRYKPFGKKNENPLFVFVARLVHMKRADLCIKAIALLKKNYPTIKLAIIGNGPEENNLIDLTRKLHLENNVILVNKNNFFLSKKSHDIKIDYMRKSWALLLPSVKEGWGMVVTEAAACGTPAIVSDVTGLRDSVVANKTGIILSSNPTKESLAEAIEKMMDKNIRESYSENAIVWSKNFDWDQSFKKFYQLILPQ